VSNVSQLISQDKKQVVISVNGRFDFSSHQAFRKAYCDLPGPGIEYRVNMSKTNYIDSSALGMLLLLREHAGNDKAQVVIEDPSETVRKVLEIANFQKMFVFK
jgi:anti-anti-sigma factor